jgi:hypothetical protein
MLRRETSLAGAGIPDAQPLVVFAGPDDFVFSADLASSTPGDRVAVYQLPGASPEATEGADSASVVLPAGDLYPGYWYGPGATTGPAETIRFSFEALAGGGYALTRTVNSLAADTLLRGLERIEGRDFFSYKVMESDGTMRELAGDFVWHEAPVHESQADTAGSALTDSIKLVEIAFKVRVRGRRPDETVERAFAMGVALKNAGLVRNAACGDPPTLGVTPNAEVTALDPLSVTVTWTEAVDEASGEQDVQQYTLYRKELDEDLPWPIASLPPNPSLTFYSYIDTAVEPGATYVYLLGATDCTPAQSELGESPTVTVPNV